MRAYLPPFAFMRMKTRFKREAFLLGAHKGTYIVAPNYCRSRGNFAMQKPHSNSPVTLHSFSTNSKKKPPHHDLG